MTMRCVAQRHGAFKDLGLLEPVLKHRGYEVEYVQAGLHALSEQEWVDADLVVVATLKPIRGWATRSRASGSA